MPVFFFSSCRAKKTRRILTDDVYAEGNISPDSIYSGRIKFYDTATINLVQESNYDNGILHGPRTDYHPNGKIKLKGMYRDGKKYGLVKFYDTDGRLATEQYFYYDLVVGPTIEYKNKEPRFYYFSSIENRDLFFIDYDSIQGKKIEEIQESFFFYNIYETSENFEDTSNIKKEYFLYLLNPPKFKFSYSLCIIKNNYDIIKEVVKFGKEKIWDTFVVSRRDLKENEIYALKLEVDDPSMEEFAVMFKKLKL